MHYLKKKKKKKTEIKKSSHLFESAFIRGKFTITCMRNYMMHCAINFYIPIEDSLSHRPPITATSMSNIAHKLLHLREMHMHQSTSR